MRAQLEKGGLKYGSNAKKGVLGADQVKKGGSLPRHIPMLNICEYPPPPGSILKLDCVSNSCVAASSPLKFK